MKNDEEIVESLKAGGVIGTELGALLLKKVGEDALPGILAGAAIPATFKANEKAIKMNMLMYVEENGNIYHTKAGGIKKFIRKIEKPNFKLQQYYTLK
jgi:hypothetical protein